LIIKDELIYIFCADNK